MMTNCLCDFDTQYLLGCCCSFIKSCLTLCDLMDCIAQQAPLSSWNFSLSLLKFMTIELEMPSNHLILCCPLLLFPSVFPSINVFSNVAAVHIRWPKYWSFRVSLSNNYSGWFPLWLTGLIFLQCKGFWRVFSSIIQKHQFFSAQSSLWSNSHIHTWLLKIPQLWLYGPLDRKSVV